MSKISKFFRDVTGMTAADEARRSADEQIGLAREQKRLLTEQRDKDDAEKRVAQQAANRKTVRSARRTMRRAGFLGSNAQELKDSLG